MSTIISPRQSKSPFITKHELSALKLVQSSVLARRLAKGLLVLLCLAIIAMFVLPWQQSAKGTGRVTAYVPQERQQPVMSPIKGIVKRVAEGVFEGSRVKEGDIIVEIGPTADNLNDQISYQIKDLQDKINRSEAKAKEYENMEYGFIEARDFAVSAADELVKAAEAKVRAKEDLIPAYISKEWQARTNYNRQLRLLRDGVKSRKEVEKMKKDWEVARAELDSVRMEVTTAEKELSAKIEMRKEKMKIGQTKVDKARADREDALGARATAQKELRALRIKQSELERQVIRAPRDGTIFRMPVYVRGQAIKAGEKLFTIVPETTDLAVELWLAGNDVPLVRPGDHVRLQFEGWPAVQFAGWPSVAVGTFGGKWLRLTRPTTARADFESKFRPDADTEWPSHRFLRQGVRANGWVMLQQVPLGYEMWRQLNGFPPVVAEDEPSKKGDEKEDKGKKPKLPKA